MNYKIKYKVFDSKRDVIKGGEIIVRNKDNDIHAKISLEGYLKKKYEDFYCL